MKIIIYGGHGRNKEKEPVKKVEIPVGRIVSIIGQTGSGKTQLINDINCRADRNTITNRKVVFEKLLKDRIALISQHNTFLTDLEVGEFLEIHAKIKNKPAAIVNKVIDLANQLSGEAIKKQQVMTALSGGQTRSLMIADALIISDSPIVLLDEIENAGINKIKVLDLLKKRNKILIFVSHDPRIILLSDMRILMKNGVITKVIETSAKERELHREIIKKDDYLVDLRDKLRAGMAL